MNNKLYVLCKIVLTINVIASFLLFGMPKFLTCEHHFIGIIGNYDAYLSRQDLVLTDAEGNEISILKDTRVYIHHFYGDDVSIIGGTEPEVKTVSAWTEEPHARFEISIEELEDPEKFENVSDLYKQEQDEKRREGEAEFDKYMMRKRLWFFFPAEHLINFMVGLLFAGLSFAIGIALYKNRYNVKGNTVFFSVLSLIKIAGIVYFYLHPVFCS
jgi:hypothetical protein